MEGWGHEPCRTSQERHLVTGRETTICQPNKGLGWNKCINQLEINAVNLKLQTNQSPAAE